VKVFICFLVLHIGLCDAVSALLHLSPMPPIAWQELHNPFDTISARYEPANQLFLYECREFQFLGRYVYDHQSYAVLLVPNGHHYFLEKNKTFGKRHALIMDIESNQLIARIQKKLLVLKRENHHA
jgi:hypothetical protein